MAAHGILIAVCAGLIGLFTACGDTASPTAAPDPAADALQQELRDFLRHSPRLAGTPTHARAVRWITQKAEACGVTVRPDSFTVETPRGQREMVNLHVRIPAQNPAETRAVILGGHFDTKIDMPPGFTGANDSGSSVVILLDLIRYYTQNPPPCNLEIYFFDGEESYVTYRENDGLWGSTHAANRLTDEDLARIQALILVDMAGDADLAFTLPADTDPDLYLLAQKAAEIHHMPHLITLYHNRIIDDHNPFETRGIPCINFIDFNYGPGNSFWHTEKDVEANTSGESLRITARIIRTLIDLKFSTGPAL